VSGTAAAPLNGVRRVTIRPAVPADIDTIVEIIAHHASQGLMLPRSHSGMLAGLDAYVVAEHEGAVIGCGGLQQYSADSAEIYGLATSASGAPAGTGRAIVEVLLERARSLGIVKVFALTLATGFFQKMGFHAVEHKDLPLKVWTDCVVCPKFGNCDEIAMVRDLDIRS
jgi:amino-acid N-acetyltransferase